MNFVSLSVQGMTCGHCVKAIATSLGDMAGVQSVKVDLKGASAEVGFDPQGRKRRGHLHKNR